MDEAVSLLNFPLPYDYSKDELNVYTFFIIHDKEKDNLLISITIEEFNDFSRF